ncbi:MAG: UvrD-helicase domain-containing protein [Nanoarchaeota archaeon]|nr:UvrD-helicase domain-containing protein [Nanoarchaeota archaeon]
MQSYHLQILEAMKSFDFNIGKTTLVSFLIGDSNPTIDKNRMDELDLYGCLYKLKKPHIYAIIGELEKDELITPKYTTTGLKTLRITPKGRDELITPSKNYNSASSDEKVVINEIKNNNLEETNLEHIEGILPQFSFFTQGLNKKQQLSVLNPHNSILCVAGAGSGKTTVLIKRIEFLVQFRGVKQEEILAITFTTKARDEMRKRLEEKNLHNVVIHTFNSYSEQELRKVSSIQEHLVPSNSVLTFSQKIQIIRGIIQEFRISFEQISREYFSTRQRSEKSGDDLFLTFCHDMFSILDYSKNTHQDIHEYSKQAPQSIQHVAKLIEIILTQIPIKMNNLKIRDFTDQILQIQEIYNEFPTFIPKFEHILVDEFQDINSIQLTLIQTLKNTTTTSNIFCVGDPRQSIYNWRGSEINFILDFEKYFQNSHIIMLELNYRSNTTLVEACNQIIKPLGLIDLQTPKEIIDQNAIELVECKNTDDEFLIALHHIKSSIKSGVEPNEIFVLARTNRVLEDFSRILLTHNVEFNLKSDDFSTKRQEPIRPNQIILATIHAIKGQEAQKVIILEATTQYFPNKVQDNEFIAHVKSISSYDKYQEELRLFYVACSRAKEKLIVLYSGTLSQFFPSKDKQDSIKSGQKELQTFLFQKPEIPKSKSKEVTNNLNNSTKHYVKMHQLKQLRLSIASRLGIQSFEVFNNTQLDKLLTSNAQFEEDISHILGEESFIAKKYGKEILDILQ